MEGEVFVIILVAIGCTTGIIKSWLNRKNNNSELEHQFDRLAKAFVQHKKDMEQRVENLEAIITEEDGEEEHYSQIEAPEAEESTLTNDLRQGEKTRS
ncbi:hypothetical protein [Fodinibius halophilus]|uniref:Uncharacterized protein n=1 Tax=Fodinibius halophilus TaxID=1736908 RepID=A0A6M1T266_9BACT|nr:hypothetical protein [Fodinibius halophilus]NGP87315.1 hypothetical protein [Fodinibius halophilus]